MLVIPPFGPRLGAPVENPSIATCWTMLLLILYLPQFLICGYQILTIGIYLY